MRPKNTKILNSNVSDCSVINIQPNIGDGKLFKVEGQERGVEPLVEGLHGVKLPKADDTL